MNNGIYETIVFNSEDARLFVSWFNDNIGTEIERTSVDGCAFFVCYDLYEDEIDRISSFETYLMYEYKCKLNQG